MENHGIVFLNFCGNPAAIIISAHFEGSLGRLTTSSVHNPRQIIDLLAKSVSETAGTARIKTNVGKELRKSRQLLMDIEKVYICLIRVLVCLKKMWTLGYP